MSDSPDTYLQLVFNVPVDGPFTYSLPEDLAAASDEVVPQPGQRVVAPFGRRSLTGFVVGHTDSLPAGLTRIRPITRVLDPEPLIDSSLIGLSAWMSRLYFASQGECLAAMLPSGRRAKALPVAGPDDASFVDRPVTLSDEQQQAVAAITDTPDSRHYLYGLTGSGKTEVFMRAARATLDEGRSVIYLVPEIALTHQVVRTIRSRFPEEAAVIHSGLTPSQRLTEWHRIKAGEARFVIGARSAVFAPVRNLGLICIDEEHEGSYKSSASPRYHARQVAMKRASDAGARLVMGSATPSVEAWYAMQRGSLAKIQLTRRLSGGSVPEVELVDLKKEDDLLSVRLVEEMHATLDLGKQVILFLNRRGFSYYFHCKSCGYEMTCRNCSVSLTYHKGRGYMVCHYCGHHERPVSVCPDCGSLEVGYSGFGTEKVEEDVRTRFPAARIERIDADTRKSHVEDVMKRFRDGEIDILLGTQMVAKGLNFPGVRLVGLIVADSGLNLPDFRAAERTFGLIVQVAGRAGRYADDGRVIVQSFKPGHEAVRLAGRLDLESFYEGELSMRQALGFPPFARLMRVVFRGRKPEAVARAADAFAAELRAACNTRKDAAEVLGPSEAPISIIAGNHRHQIIVRAMSFDVTHAIVRRVAENLSVPSGMYREIDVDPVSLL